MRDVTPAREAYQEFSELIGRFPKANTQAMHANE